VVESISTALGIGSPSSMGLRVLIWSSTKLRQLKVISFHNQETSPLLNEVLRS